jgi:hypothetical protein
MDALTMAAQGPLGGEQLFNVYTGVCTGAGSGSVPTAAALGLEPPRYCGQCGRRMVVQINPVGWWAKCSRHGRVESKDLEQR